MGPSRLHRTENERVIVFQIKKFFQKIFPKKLKHKIMNYPEGTIKTNTQGNKYIRKDGKWVYMKKPKEERKISKENPKRVVYNYPPIRLSENMRETQYPGYYITEDGRAYRKPGKYDRNGKYGEINENGLIYLKPAFRGHSKYPEHQYECINISMYDETGKYKQIKKSIHQLVAEAFIPNPERHSEILHIDGNNRNNHYTNLKWGTHKENMEMVGLPEGSIRRAKGKSSDYIKKDGEWILIPKNTPPWNRGLKGVSWNTLPDGTVTTRKVNGKPGTFIKQNGKWVYQTNNPKSRGKSFKENKPKRKPLPDGTIRTRADGTTWVKENGKWVYQKTKK